MHFSTVLIANRGEIACRVIRTARALGYETVAVFSDADRDALHVKMADKAVHIGPSDLSQSYLSVEKILSAAKQSGADAIHPGYGFLSENASFSQRCQSEGITFIGPGVKAIELMGDKAVSKRLMLDAGVPCIPGYQDEEQTDDILLEQAKEIGYPLMVKATAGGGGRGMRLVFSQDDLASALIAARSEALKAFGSDLLIIERALISPRHIEIQIFADNHGNAVYLGERDCSMQRRHQKVIEEAPSPVVSEALRERMGKAAVDAAKAVDYCGAGTVEFLLDDSENFYFLEMNTRLQVEHPITEMITGLDLVEWQLLVAANETLPLTQEQVTLEGHAIEVRLYAEDPYQQFLPCSGDVQLWRAPEGEGIRVDSGLQSGERVSPFFDPMLAKIISSGATREIARRRMIKALKQTVLFGVSTNKHFLADALAQDKFVTGEVTTGFIPEVYGDEGPQRLKASNQSLALAGALFCELGGAEFPVLGFWRSTGVNSSVFQLRPQDADEDIEVNVNIDDDHLYSVSVADETIQIRILQWQDGLVKYECDGLRDCIWAIDTGAGSLQLDVGDHQFSVVDSLQQANDESADDGDSNIRAAMHGAITRVMVAEGDKVTKGQGLLVLEAMKMEHEMFSGCDGVVAQVLVNEGQQVATGGLLIEVVPDEK